MTCEMCDASLQTAGTGSNSSASLNSTGQQLGAQMGFLSMLWSGKECFYFGEPVFALTVSNLLGEAHIHSGSRAALHNLTVDINEL